MRQPSETDAAGTRRVRVLGAGAVFVAPGTPPATVIARLAAAQRGRMARWQLLAAGVSGSAIDRCLRSRRLLRVHHGVYAVPSTDEIPFAADAAAVLAGGPGTALSNHSAAVLWELRPGVACPVHITLPHSRSVRGSEGLAVHRSRILTAADIRVHRGLPVTSPARTLLDVAATLTDRDVERLLDEALFARRLTTPAAIRAVLRRAGGHPGVARLTRVAEGHARSTKTDSEPEESLLTLIRAAGLPAPRHQVHILDYRLDRYWPEARLAAEVDGYGSHGTRARFESDRRRDARLLAERGISVLRFTRLQIETRPYEVVATLARTLAAGVAP